MPVCFPDWNNNAIGSLEKLDDPAFMALWAAARAKLALTPESNPEHHEAKRRYDALATEYRRRIDGPLIHEQDGS